MTNNSIQELYEQIKSTSITSNKNDPFYGKTYGSSKEVAFKIFKSWVNFLKTLFENPDEFNDKVINSIIFFKKPNEEIIFIITYYKIPNKNTSETNEFDILRKNHPKYIKEELGENSITEYYTIPRINNSGGLCHYYNEKYNNNFYFFYIKNPLNILFPDHYFFLRESKTFKDGKQIQQTLNQKKRNYLSDTIGHTNNYIHYLNLYENKDMIECILKNFSQIEKIMMDQNQNYTYYKNDMQKNYNINSLYQFIKNFGLNYVMYKEEIYN